ncbi:hypothetical protein ACFSZS_26825 [Seohaeicola zhoushanensis]
MGRGAGGCLGQDRCAGSERGRGELAALPAPTPTERFALGGVRFLRAIEATLQLRWRMGMSGRTMDLPVLRLPVAENPNPEPFDPKFVEVMATDLLARMAEAEAPLDGIADADEVALRVNLADLWFDVNMNGARDKGEGVIEIAAGTVLPRRFRSSGKRCRRRSGSTPPTRPGCRPIHTCSRPSPSWCWPIRRRRRLPRWARPPPR